VQPAERMAMDEICEKTINQVVEHAEHDRYWKVEDALRLGGASVAALSTAPLIAMGVTLSFSAPLALVGAAGIGVGMAMGSERAEAVANRVYGHFKGRELKEQLSAEFKTASAEDCLARFPLIGASPAVESSVRGEIYKRVQQEFKDESAKLKSESPSSGSVASELDQLRAAQENAWARLQHGQDFRDRPDEGRKILSLRQELENALERGVTTEAALMERDAHRNPVHPYSFQTPANFVAATPKIP
jgi:hypothetical protein